MIVSHEPRNAKSATHDQARNRLKSARSALSVSVQEYFRACQAMRAACCVSPRFSRIPSLELDLDSIAINEELFILADEESIHKEARSLLTDAQNASKMNAPIYSLPSEILTRIFTKAICSCAATPRWSGGPVSSPLSLASVCRQWRDIILDDKLIWTHLDLELGKQGSPGHDLTLDMWAKHSRGAPISICIRRNSSLEERERQNPIYDDDFGVPDYDDDDTPLTYYGEEEEAPAVNNILKLLAVLSRQIVSVTFILCTHNVSILERLLRGVSRSTRILKVWALDWFPPLIVPHMHQTSSVDFLEVLHFHNAAPPWRNWRFYNLTDLRLQNTSTEGYRWSMTPQELFSVLSKCLKLEYLMMHGIRFSESLNHVQTPVLLRELKVLDIQSECAGALEPVLGTINPGEAPLRLSVTLKYFQSQLRTFLPALRAFANRSNVTMLQVTNSIIPCFASQLGPLPRAQMLSLEGWYITDFAHAAEFIGDPKYTVNPSPPPAHHTLWPHVQHLYLKHCTIEQEHIRRLISPRSLQTLYLNRCFKYEEAGSSRVLLDPHVTENHLSALSAELPRIQHISDDSVEWSDWRFQLKGFDNNSGMDVMRER
ncbi:hypothetical protein FRC07_002020 [Ceratobasidium sp. 392]|nr:hypothetical protein FRC07_002020 [Ceratobasidium sp. 392]